MPRKKTNPRRRPVFEELQSIYETGDTLDMTRLERKTKKPRSVLVGLIIFFALLAAAAWAGFFLFKPYARFEGEGVALAIEGPKEIKAGESTRYKFTYRNTERVALAALELRLILPREFRLLETSPAPTVEPLSWTLGSLGVGEGGQIELRGYFLGPDEGRTALQSIATYRPANFNADFQAITTLPIAIQGSVLEAQIEGPQEAVPGELVEYKYSILHQGSERLENLELSLEAAEIFIADGSEPPPTKDRPLRWDLGTLEPGEEKTVLVRGSFAAGAKGTSELPFVLGMVQDDALLPHRRNLATTEVLAGELALRLIVNGSTADFPADYGETLRVSLSYENQGDRTIGDLTLSLRIGANPGGLIDWDRTAIIPEGRVRAGVITWTSREIEELGRVDQGKQGTIDVTLPIVENAPAARGADELRLSGVALISKIDGRVVGRQVETPPLIVKLNTEFQTEAGARYFDQDGAALGQGPLPPEVGKRTAAQIYFSVLSSRHDLENVRIRTTLPENIDWLGQTTSNMGEVSWDQGPRTVSFRIDRLSSGEAATAEFAVGFTPLPDNVGRFIALTGEIAASARDAVTRTDLLRTQSGLTSEILKDASGKSQGVVIE